MFPEKLLGFFPGSRMEQDFVFPYLKSNILSVITFRKDNDGDLLEKIRILRDLFCNSSCVSAFEYEVSVRLAEIWLGIVRSVASLGIGKIIVIST